MPEIERRFHVVSFDQRGTGRSGLLRCPALERDPRLRDVRAGADCARRIGPARRRYTTPESVEDVEAIRVALGVERLTLFGISYGTELALAYARAHPDRVERMILDSVVDPDDRDPFGLSGFRAMGPSLAALCPEGCRGVSADPGADLAALAARLRSGPLRGVVYDSRGRAHKSIVGSTAVADLLYDADYNPPLRAAVPAAVKAALAGDPAPLLRLEAEGGKLARLPGPRTFSSARYATVCEETPLPWDRTTPVGERWAEVHRRAAALGQGAFWPFDLSTAAADEIGLCLHWPDVPSGLAPAVPGPYPAVPTLILQGGEDLRTPPETSARVAGQIPGAQRVVVPGVGHAVVGADPSGCGARRLRRFLDRQGGGRRLPGGADRRSGRPAPARDVRAGPPGRRAPRARRPDGRGGGLDRRGPHLRALAGVPGLRGRRPAGRPLHRAQRTARRARGPGGRRRARVRLRARGRAASPRERRQGGGGARAAHARRRPARPARRPDGRGAAAAGGCRKCISPRR